MKGLILAAGKGTRLRPLTDRRPKALIPLANQPLIAYPLQKLLLAGISEIGVVVGDDGEEIEQVLRHVPAQLTFIRQSEPLGLAHAVSCAREFCGEHEFVLLFCDNLFGEPLSFALAEWAACHAEAAALIHVLEVDDPRAFGVAEVIDGWAVGLVEKPARPKSRLAVLGIDCLTPLIFEAITRIKPTTRGELEITDAIAELIRMGHRVRVRSLTGFWYDTGTFPDLIEAHPPLMEEFGAFQVKGRHAESQLRGPVGIARGSTVESSALLGPVLIGQNCLVADCHLGPHVSVGDGCTLTGCKLRGCQVYPGTELTYQQDFDAILDGGLRVDRNSKPPG